VNRRERISKELLVEPGTDANIADRDAAWTGGPEFEELSAKHLSHTAKKLLANGVKELSKAQELLWASDSYALLVVFQALDAAGKDSTIEHVMSGVNPQGVQVVSFKQPSSEELDHNFLWRTSKALPERGRIGIFNRSHYEEVIALRVHPEWLQKQKLPPGSRGPSFWAGRHEDINAFERHLDRNGTKIVKFFLHVSSGSRSGASSLASTSLASSGSSARPTWPNGRTGTTTCGRSRRRSRPHPRPGRPGTSSPPITSRSCRRWSPPSSSTRSIRWS
jgi:hypothetical protein